MFYQNFYGQEKLKELSVQGNLIMGKSLSEDYGGDIYDFTFSYLNTKSSKFHFGGGAGIGTTNLTRTYSVFSNLLDEDVKRGNSLVMSLYGRTKYKFNQNPTSFFALFDLGYNIASLESWSGASYNPLGLFLTPAIGCDFSTKSDYKFFLILGIQEQFIKYNYVEYEWNDFLNKMTYKDFELENNSFSSLYLSFGISF
jgi:hypothetical protein